jgi:transketolase
MTDAAILTDFARRIRIHSLEQIFQAKSGHPGGSLSAADLLAVLYSKVLRFKKDDPGWPNRDRFVLSKGHACPARTMLGPDYHFELGKGRILRPGGDITIAACSVEVARALDAAEVLANEGVSARVLNLSTLKPIDTELLALCARETGCFVTAEDHNVYGGLGGAVAEALAQTQPCPIEFVGVRNVFGESGEPNELAEKYGLTGSAIAAACKRVIRKKGRGG